VTVPVVELVETGGRVRPSSVVEPVETARGTGLDGLDPTAPDSVHLTATPAE